MADMPRISLFCEDNGHELFARALVKKIVKKAGTRADLQVVSARGGHGRAIKELIVWQRKVLSGDLLPRPEILAVLIDGNCHGWNEARREIAKNLYVDQFPHLIIGCPDPHVERWCIADPPAFTDVVGADPFPDPGRCERGLYKRLMRQSIEDAGAIVGSEPMEFAPDIVDKMVLFRAGKNQPSLKHFVDGLKSAVQSYSDA